MITTRFERLADLARRPFFLSTARRGFVWRANDRLLFLDSLVQGLPLGTFLEDPVGPAFVDGLQRLETLRHALTSPEGEDRHGEPWRAGYNLRTEYVEMMYPGETREYRRYTLPFDVLLDDNAFDQWPKPPDYARKARDVRNTVLDTMLTVVVLSNVDVETAAHRANLWREYARKKESGGREGVSGSGAPS